MKKIMYVVCAVLQNGVGEILLVQRPEGKDFGGCYEFPGGKIDPGETPEEALNREIFEELNLIVDPTDMTPLTFLSHAYSDFHLVLFFYGIKKWSGDLMLKEGQPDYAWVNLSEPCSLPLIPIDEAFLPELCVHILCLTEHFRGALLSKSLTG